MLKKRSGVFTAFDMLIHSFNQSSHGIVATFANCFGIFDKNKRGEGRVKEKPGRKGNGKKNELKRYKKIVFGAGPKIKQHVVLDRDSPKFGGKLSPAPVLKKKRQKNDGSKKRRRKKNGRKNGNENVFTFLSLQWLHRKIIRNGCGQCAPMSIVDRKEGTEKKTIIISHEKQNIEGKQKNRILCSKKVLGVDTYICQENKNEKGHIFFWRHLQRCRLVTNFCTPCIIACIPCCSLVSC